MLRLRDIMTTDVHAMSPEMSIRDAMDMLVAHHIGGAPVVANRQVKGTITTTDLLAFAASLPNESDESPWKISGAAALPPTGRGERSAERILHRDVGWGGHRLERTVPGGSRTGMECARGAHGFRSHDARNPVFTLPPNAPVEAAAEFMKRTGVHRVLVAENGELAGIVSSMDLARAIAEHKLTSRTYTFGPDSEFDVRGWDLTEPRVPSGERTE